MGYGVLAGRRYHPTPASRRVGGALAASTAGLARKFLRPKDQSITNACTGGAFTVAARVRRCLEVLAETGDEDQAHACPDYSMRGVYTLGRLKSMSSRDEPLLDVGADPYFVLEGAGEWGMPLESTMPFSVEAIDERPFPDELLDASAHVLRGAYDVDAPNRIQAIRDELEQGYPVTYASPIDHAFEDYDGSAPAGPMTGPIVGGHMMTILEYDADSGLFLNYTTWSRWGAGNGMGGTGLFWATPDHLLDPRVEALIAIVASPR